MDLVQLVAVVGGIVLVVIAVCVGAELDTENQRRERRRLADERKLRGEALRGRVRRNRRPLCEECPFRDDAA